MPLLPAALIAPAGRIEPAMFPADTAEELTARVQAYLNDAYNRSDAAGLGADQQDRAARIWAYHRAFDSTAIRLDAEAARLDLDDAGGRARVKDQRDAMRARAAELLAEYFDTVPSPAAVSTPRLASRSVQANIVW